MDKRIDKNSIYIAPKPKSLTDRAKAKAEALRLQELRNAEYFASGRDSGFNEPFKSAFVKPLVWHKEA